MRSGFLLLATVAVLLILITTQARADVRPVAVKVRFDGEPRPAAKGAPFRVTLEFVAAYDTEISNIRLEGIAQEACSFHPPSRLKLAKRQVLPVVFEVPSGVLSNKLTVQYEANGQFYSRVFDFSPEAYREATTPRPVRVVLGHPEALVSEPEDALLILADGPLPTQPQEDAFPGAQPEDVDVQQRGGWFIRFHGNFEYVRPSWCDANVRTVGVYNATVRLMDEDLIDREICATHTDVNGDFDMTCWWERPLCCDNWPDLYVKYELTNMHVAVQEANVFDFDYYWVTPTWHDYLQLDLNLGNFRPPVGEMQAAHILTNLSRAWDWVKDNEGYDTPAVDVQWPDGDTGAYYNGEIHIGRDREWLEDTHVHEWAHHWILNYGAMDAPWYCNGFCDGDSGSPNCYQTWNGVCGHCGWCMETDHDAWSEGWPNWLADVVTRTFTTPCSTRPQEDLDTCCQDGLLHDPWTTEGFLGALLRDIEDSGAPGVPAEDHPQYPGFVDSLALGTDEIFEVTDLDNPKTPLAFLSAFKARYPQHRENLWETAKNCGYEIDAESPGLATNLISPSHPIGSASNDPTVSFTWNRATDDASGVEGYGMRAATGGYEMPAAVQRIADVTSYTTNPLPPGTYYFSLRAKDRAGNWSSGYTGYGPFTILPWCGDGTCNGSEDACSCPVECWNRYCGDGCCNGSEDCRTCSVDCPAICGDWCCSATENDCDCPQDCAAACGDGCCNGSETACSCVQDCPPACGDGCCNGSETACDCPQDCASLSNDCNANTVPDECELVGNDCNINDVPDECELEGNDCNTNLTPDDCELIGDDCNANGVPDECDIAAGTSQDCNGNAIPDECENDCNCNNIDDSQDVSGHFAHVSPPLAIGTPSGSASYTISSPPQVVGAVVLNVSFFGRPSSLLVVKVNGIGVAGGAFSSGAGSCAPLTGVVGSSATDFNTAVAGGDAEVTLVILDAGFCGMPIATVRTTYDFSPSADCNANGTPDECDITAGTSNDANGNGLPDECEGACCSPISGSCTVLTDLQCAAADGVYEGDGTTCNPNPCFGACCLANDRCEERKEAACINTQAPSDCCEEHLDFGCTDAACEACVCSVDSLCCDEEWYDTCVDIALNPAICQPDCLPACTVPPAGEFHGPGTSCDPNPCVAEPTGACCLGDDSCEELTEEACINTPARSDCCEDHLEFGCSDRACEACVCGVDFLCCHEEWYYNCTDIAQDPGICGPLCLPGCFAPLAEFQGPGTDCNPNPCVPPPGDADGDGDVDLDDYTPVPSCLNGPGGTGVGCEIFDLDGNGAVDLRDVAVIQAAFTGSS